MVIVNENYNVFNQCPECNGYVIKVEEKGETVCSQCGLILNEREFILSHTEKRAYTKHEKAKKERTGIFISPLLSDLGLCTIIDKTYIHNNDLKRMVKRDSYLSWKDRNFLIATTELKRLGSLLNIPGHVITLASRLYKKVYKNKLLKGRTIKGMAIVCLYYACRYEKIPRSYNELVDESIINRKTFNQYYKIICNQFNLKTPTTDPISYIPKYISKLKLNNTIEQLTIKIIKQYINKNPSFAKNPKGLCAGAIYLAVKLNNIKITQKEITDIIGVTEVTLRSRYKEIIDKVKFFNLI